MALAGAVQVYESVLATGTIEYEKVFPGQTGVVPVTTPGVAGRAFFAMLSVLAALVPPQPVAVTDIEAVTYVPEKLTVTLLVPCPDSMVAFAGAVQL